MGTRPGSFRGLHGKDASSKTENHVRPLDSCTFGGLNTVWNHYTVMNSLRGLVLVFTFKLLNI